MSQLANNWDQKKKGPGLGLRLRGSVGQSTPLKPRLDQANREISIYDQANMYSSAMIRGRVVGITQVGAEDHIDKLNMKYNGSPKYAYHDPRDPRVLIRASQLQLTKPRA